MPSLQSPCQACRVGLKCLQISPRAQLVGGTCGVGRHRGPDSPRWIPQCAPLSEEGVPIPVPLSSPVWSAVTYISCVTHRLPDRDVPFMPISQTVKLYPNMLSVCTIRVMMPTLQGCCDCMLKYAIGDIFKVPERKHSAVIRSRGSVPRLDWHPGSPICWSMTLNESFNFIICKCRLSFYCFFPPIIIATWCLLWNKCIFVCN